MTVSSEPHKGWVAVDFDGTLATYHGWRGPADLGEPIPPMIAMVNARLAAGDDVRIFTARAWSDGTPGRDRDRDLAIAAIQSWCAYHIGKVLPVTCVKDLAMWVLYDDRCVQVERNTGRIILDNGVPCPVCDAEAVCRGTQGERKRLHCFACKTDFTPEQQTFQAGFKRGLAEGRPHPGEAE